MYIFYLKKRSIPRPPYPLTTAVCAHTAHSLPVQFPGQAHSGVPCKLCCHGPKRAVTTEHNTPSCSGVPCTLSVATGRSASYHRLHGPAFAPDHANAISGTACGMPVAYNTATDTRCTSLLRCSQDQGTDQHMCAGENPYAVFDRMQWQPQPHLAHSHTCVTAAAAYTTHTDSEATGIAHAIDTRTTQSATSLPEHLEATKMPKKMKPNRTYMPAECGGVTTPPLPPAAWGGMGGRDG